MKSKAWMKLFKNWRENFESTRRVRNAAWKSYTSYNSIFLDLSTPKEYSAAMARVRAVTPTAKVSPEAVARNLAAVGIQRRHASQRRLSRLVTGHTKARRPNHRSAEVSIITGEGWTCKAVCRYVYRRTCIPTTHRPNKNTTATTKTNTTRTDHTDKDKLKRLKDTREEWRLNFENLKCKMFQKIILIPISHFFLKFLSCS